MPVGEWWARFYRENIMEHSKLVNKPFVSGNFADGFFLLPPPVLEITLVDGLWTKINKQTGLLFDLAEEEEIAPDASEIIVYEIKEIVNFYKKQSPYISRILGWEEKKNGKNIIGTMNSEQLVMWLLKLASFLESEALKQNIVCAIF